MKDTIRFSPTIANRHGINAAVMMSFFDQVFENRQDDDERFIFDGNGGCYFRITYREISDQMPFFTIKQVRDIINRLVEEDELEAKKSTLHPMDHTKMYRITHAPFHPGTKDPF